MKRLPLLVLAALFLLSASTAFAGERIELNAGANAYDLQLLQSTPERTLLRLEINHFDLTDLEIDGRGYQAVTLGSRALHMERGLPALPTIRESLAIPDDAAMSLRIVETEYRRFKDLDIAPSKGNILRNVDPAMVAHSFDPFYAGDAWYPEHAALLDTPYIMRDTRGVVLEMNPFRYNPATSTLEVATSLTVEIVADGPGRVNVLTRKPATRVQEFEAMYSTHFLNHAGAMSERYTSIPEVGSMLVITYDAFRSAVQPFVDWKNQMGIPTTLVDVSAVGSTGTQIKAYIQNLYDTEGVTFVVLVGDVAQIPYFNNGGASDPSYGFLAGSDSYPEAFIGRFSAENAAQVTTQVERSIEYERDAQAGASWYHQGMGIASSEGSGIGDDGEADWEHMDVIRAKLLDFTYTLVDQIYETNGGSASQVSSGLNAGRSIINYCGHGYLSGWSTTGFSNTHVNALVNDNMLPFISSVACNTGEFQSGTCFGEAWMRATNGGEPTGAVGFYGSTISMSWAPPMSAQDETIDLLVSGEKRTFGGLSVNGSCQMIDEYGSTGETEMKMWTIFGDPSLRVRTDSPATVTASHIGLIDPILPTFTVTTEPGNLVALSHGGEFVGSAFADAGGNAEIAIVGDLPDPGLYATLTVSGFNRFTHVEDVLVTVLQAGTLEGTVSNLSNGGTMLPGVTVLVEQTGQSFASAVDGAYSGLVQEGVYTVTAEHESFAPMTVYGVSVLEDGVTTQDFALEDILGPYIESTTVLPHTADTMGPYVVETFITDMSEVASSRCYYALDSGPGIEIPLTLVDPYTGLCRAEIPGQGVNTMVRYWIESEDVAGNESRDPELLNEYHSFWVLLAVTVEDEDMESANGWVVGDTSDDATTGLWTRVDPIGVVEGVEQVQPEDDASTDGTLCFITGNAETGTQGADDVDGGQTTLLSPVFDLSNSLAVSVSYRRWYTNDTGNNPGSDIWLVQATDDGVNWVDLENTSTSERSWHLVSFLLDDYIDLTSTVQIRFIASDEGSGSVVEAGVDEFMLAGFADPTMTDLPASLPARARLLAASPNPFNPKTTLRFELPAAARVELVVYDTQGRRVRTLLSGAVMPAGGSAVDWDGRDDRGEQVGSGVYFYRLVTDKDRLAGKAVLLK